MKNKTTKRYDLGDEYTVKKDEKPKSIKQLRKEAEKEAEERQKKNYIYDKQSGQWVSVYDAIHGGEINEFYDLAKKSTNWLQFRREHILWNLLGLFDTAGISDEVREKIKHTGDLNAVREVNEELVNAADNCKNYFNDLYTLKAADTYFLLSIMTNLTSQALANNPLRETDGAVAGVFLGVGLAQLITHQMDKSPSFYKTYKKFTRELEVVEEELARRESLGDKDATIDDSNTFTVVTSCYDENELD